MRLGELADRRAGVLSLGNKQRLSLARALLHRPELLVLDEPANALDPAGIVEVRELLRSLADEHGVTVFMSSHILAEVAHLADRIGIVHEGRLLEELDRDQLRAKERVYVEVGVSEPTRAATLLAARASRTSSTPTTGCGSSTRRSACRRWLACSSAPGSTSPSSPRHTRTSRRTSCGSREACE